MTANITATPFSLTETKIPLNLTVYYFFLFIVTVNIVFQYPILISRLLTSKTFTKKT